MRTARWVTHPPDHAHFCVLSVRAAHDLALAKEPSDCCDAQDRAHGGLKRRQTRPRAAHYVPPLIIVPAPFYIRHRPASLSIDWIRKLAPTGTRHRPIADLRCCLLTLAKPTPSLCDFERTALPGSPRAALRLAPMLST